MTEPQVTPVDTGNALLCETPANWTTALMEGPMGQRLAVTIRTTSATLTLLLSREDALKLAGSVSGAAEQMSSSGRLVVAGAGALNGGSHG